jgi:hypothetical protein
MIKPPTAAPISTPTISPVARASETLCAGNAHARPHMGLVSRFVGSIDCGRARQRAHPPHLALGQLH